MLANTSTFSRRRPNRRLSRSSAAIRLTKRKLFECVRVMAPTLIALSFAGAAHAQGTMDFSGAQTLMGTFNNFQLDRQVEPLVMESEISGLADLHAFMKYQNYVTRFSFPYFDMPLVANGFEPRERPDDKLPYQPKRTRPAHPVPVELKQEPEPSNPATSDGISEIEEIEPEIALAPDDAQNLITRG